MQVNNSQCFLSGFNKNLACQNLWGLFSSSAVGRSCFPSSWQVLSTAVADIYLGGRTFSQVSLSYVGVFFQQTVPAWVFAGRRVGSKLSAWPGDQGSLVLSPLVGLKLMPVWLMWMGCCCVQGQDMLLRLPGAWNKHEICCQNWGICVDSLAGTIILPVCCKTLFSKGLSY